MYLLNLLLSLLISSAAMPYHPNTSIYLNKSQLESEIDIILKSDSSNQKKLCQSHPEITYLSVGAPDAKVKILLVCGIHARELISVDVCVHFLKHFTEIKRFWAHISLDVFLVANPERYKVLDGDYCIRKDAEGVDLNRNYDVWFRDGIKEKDAEAYQGPYPLSQPLSVCVDSLLKTRNYTLVLDIHTGEFSLYFEANRHSSRYNRSKAFLNEIKKNFCSVCRITTLQEARDTSNGHLFAYASRKYNVEYSFLFEIFGGYIHPSMISRNAACFKIFNPNSIQTRDFYIDKWMKAMHFTFMHLLQIKKI